MWHLKQSPCLKDRSMDKNGRGFKCHYFGMVLLNLGTLNIVDVVCDTSPLSRSMSIWILLLKQDGFHKCVGNAITIPLDVELWKNMSRASTAMVDKFEGTTRATRHLGELTQHGWIGSIFYFYVRGPKVNPKYLK